MRRCQRPELSIDGWASASCSDVLDAFRAPRLARQLVRLWHKLEDDEPATRMFADQVMREVIGTLAYRTDADLPARHARERLSAFTLRRLCDHVESRLAEDLDVTTMATVAALSPGTSRARSRRRQG